MVKIGTIWGQPYVYSVSTQPRNFEELGQNQGFVLYKTTLEPQDANTLALNLHDYAQIYLNGNYLGSITSMNPDLVDHFPLPQINATATLEILVEGMGHTNFGLNMERDRKGLCWPVVLNNKSITNWEHY